MHLHTDLSRITCFIDETALTALDTVLQTLEIPEVHMQRAKQVALVDRAGFWHIRPRTFPEESRAMFYRIYVPRCFVQGIMRRIAEATDLYLPGYGSIYAREVKVLRKHKMTFNEPLLTQICGKAETVNKENYDVLTCIVQRGMSAAISSAILEMGLSVPVISYAEGMGGRDQMGLLRITVPVEKEIMFFLIPRIDAEFLKNIIIRKARLDMPGRGFLYQFHVTAQAVNLRCRYGHRTSAATMEQVITALDQLRGSSEWRRLGVTEDKKKRVIENVREEISCFAMIMDDGQAAPYVEKALFLGAGGATRMPLYSRSYKPDLKNIFTSSAKELCNMIMPNVLCEKVLKDLKQTDFFRRPDSGIVEIASVHEAVTYTGKGRFAPAKGTNN